MMIPFAGDDPGAHFFINSESKGKPPFDQFRNLIANTLSLD